MSRAHLSLFERFLPTKVYGGTYKPLPKRLNWEEIESRPQREAGSVVKGTSKHIVVVKSPDPKVFEQAIFIVREDFFGKNGRANALKEAQKVADDYIRSAVAAPRRLFGGKSLISWLTGGAILVGLAVLAAWFLTR